MDCQDCVPIMEDWCNVREETHKLWRRLNTKMIGGEPDVQGYIEEMPEAEACTVRRSHLHDREQASGNLRFERLKAVGYARVVKVLAVSATGRKRFHGGPSTVPDRPRGRPEPERLGHRGEPAAGQGVGQDRRALGGVLDPGARQVGERDRAAEPAASLVGQSGDLGLLEAAAREVDPLERRDGLQAGDVLDQRLAKGVGTVRRPGRPGRRGTGRPW